MQLFDKKIVGDDGKMIISFRWLWKVLNAHYLSLHKKDEVFLQGFLH